MISSALGVDDSGAHGVIGSSPTVGTGLMNSRVWRFPAAAFVIRSPYAGPVGTVFFDSDGEPVAGVVGGPPVTPRMCELLPDAVRLRRPRHCCWIGMVFDVRLLSAMSFVYSYKDSLYIV